MIARDPDPNVTAARIVRESTASDEPLPTDVEAAWADWSRRIQGCDERTMTLLRAAFEAGADAGRRSG